MGQVVAVHRPQIGEAHVLKHAAGQQALLQGLFHAVGHPVDLPAQPEGAHHPPVALLEAEILGLEPLPGQVLGHRPHILSDGHAVVVEDYQQLPAALARVGQPLIGQAAGEGPVTDEGEHLIVLPQGVPGLGHAQGHGHRVGGVPGDKGVVDALIGLGKAGDAPVLPQTGHLLPAAGEHLVEVALMAHVKHQPVPAGVEHPVNGHRQLHRPQVGGQMPPCLRHIPDQLLPELPAQGGPLLVADVCQDRASSLFLCVLLQKDPSLSAGELSPAVNPRLLTEAPAPPVQWRSPAGPPSPPGAGCGPGAR